MTNSCCCSNIHKAILGGNLPFAQDQLKKGSQRIFRERFFFMKALEHVNTNLGLVRIFNPRAVTTVEKIYHLIRDYTLFYAISDGDLPEVRRIITEENDSLDLSVTIVAGETSISLLALGEMRKEGTAINGMGIYTLLANFQNPPAEYELETFDS